MSIDSVRAVFIERFGREPELITRAPGRVNLIGEHTDYNEGFVFPAAIDRFVWVAAAPTAGPSEYVSVEMGAGDWRAYPDGLQWAFAELGREAPNLQASVTSTVPIGAGVSSSAALELAFAVAWNEIASLSLSQMELALVGQRCENGFIGLRTGLMDQVASAMGKAAHAMFFDTFTREIQYAPIPPGLAIVVADTTMERSLASSKYNERRSECEHAASVLGVRALRHSTMGELEDVADLLSETVYRRARHVISENRRCLSFAEALTAGDLPRIGDLMRRSHESLREDYEVSSPELDAMAEACRTAPGCVGARMTGAGFGGACVALVERAQMDEFLPSAAKAYHATTGIEGRFLPCEAADGAGRVA